MVPPRSTVNKLTNAARNAAAMWRPITWGLALWMVVAALPFVFLYPGDGLARPVVWVLLGLAPAGIAASAALGQPQLLLGVGLAGVVPLLVACPELLGPRTTGPIQGLAVAALSLGFVAASLDLAPRGLSRVTRDRRLRRLLRWPEALGERVALVLGAVWLGLAWWVEAGAATEGLRTARVAAVAICWMAVRVVPLGRPAVHDRASSLLLRRAMTMAALVVAAAWLAAGEPS